MYKIMLVDDDVPMLKYLKKMVPWNRLDFDTPITTYSAVTALRLFVEALPDIVVMDIGIPQINGLELVERFKEIKPEVRVIFLTCHESFSYAKRAVELDANDYLIKDELTAEQFEESIVNALDSYKKAQVNSGIKSFHGIINKNKVILKQNFLEQILSGNDIQNHDIGKMIGIHWHDTDFIVGVSYLDYASLLKHFDFKDVPLIKSGIWNVAEELARDVQGLTPLLDNEKNLYLIMNFKQSMSRNIFEEFCVFLQKVQKVVYQYWKLEIMFLYSKNIISIADIGQEILKINESRNLYFYDNDTSIGSLDGESQLKLDLNSNQLLDGFGESLMKAIEYADDAEVRNRIDELAVLAETRHINPKQLIKHCVRWLRFMEVNTKGAVISDEFIHYFRQMTKLHEVIFLLKRKATQFLEASDDHQMGQKGNSRLKEIDQYIIDHLSENIYSVDVANHLYLNPSYFSRYFKNIAGQNFTDYVHNFKMKIAVKLIKENKETIKMIASRLGYSDRTYFSKVFKKYTGHSPGEYRTTKIKIPYF